MGGEQINTVLSTIEQHFVGENPNRHTFEGKTALQRKKFYRFVGIIPI